MARRRARSRTRPPAQRNNRRAGDNEGAGLLWGAVEAEAERSHLGIWASEERPRVELSLPFDDADFARERERGRRLSLDEAIEAALAPQD